MEKGAQEATCGSIFNDIPIFLKNGAGSIGLGFEVLGFRLFGVLGASGDAFSTRFPEHLREGFLRVILGSLCRFRGDWGTLWEAFWHHFPLFF